MFVTIYSLSDHFNCFQSKFCPVEDTIIQRPNSRLSFSPKNEVCICWFLASGLWLWTTKILLSELFWVVYLGFGQLQILQLLAIFYHIFWRIFLSHFQSVNMLLVAFSIFEFHDQWCEGCWSGLLPLRFRFSQDSFISFFKWTCSTGIACFTY